VTVFRIVEFDELVEVPSPHGVLLLGEVLVSSEIVGPKILRQRVLTAQARDHLILTSTDWEIKRFSGIDLLRPGLRVAGATKR
jgi:hypothetical protein